MSTLYWSSVGECRLKAVRLHTYRSMEWPNPICIHNNGGRVISPSCHRIQPTPTLPTDKPYHLAVRTCYIGEPRPRLVPELTFFHCALSRVYRAVAQAYYGGRVRDEEEEV